MDDGTIRYEDLISPDDSIKALIKQLEQLNSAYSGMVGAIKQGAKQIIDHMKATSSATAEGKEKIDDATAAANRLTRAQKELKFALSDTGKEVVWLKSQVASQNKMSIEQQKRSQALIGSYDSIRLKIRELTKQYKALSETQRLGDRGTDILTELKRQKERLNEVDDQMKLHVQTLTAVEKAEKKLAYLRSAEGQRLLELKQQISDIIKGNKQQKQSTDEVAQAVERLKAARSASRQAAYQINIEAKEANRIAKLQAQLNLSAAGSYNALAAQYELNKIKLNAMSAAERNATDAGKQLEKETLALYIEMQRLQEATGNHRLSVGNYAKSWDGLGISVSQVVRELPAVAVSMNTFFLGISNNIPILIDEINKLRAENKQAIAEGKQAKSVVGSVVKALLSWNTVLVIGLTILSAHGKEIIDWIASLGKAKGQAISMTDAVDNLNKELEKTNGSYGSNITTLKKLSEEWKKLTSRKEQLQWIRDNKTEFDKLDVSVRNVADAENIFVNHTEVMVNALKARAKAAAAMKLAADKYEEALIKEAEAEAEAAKGPNWQDKLVAGTAQAGASQAGLRPGEFEDIAEANKQSRIQALKDLSKAANETADQYFNMAKAITAASDAELKAAGIDSAHKNPKKEPRGPRQRDLTDQIWRNDLTIRKKYELSLSALQRNEFERRRIEAIDQTNQTIREMQEKFRKNEVFLTNPDGKNKPLTDEQRQQIEQQQKEIEAIIVNQQRLLQIKLQKIENERQVDSMNKLRQAMQFRIDIIANSLEEEKQLKIKQLEEEESMYSTSGTTINGETVITGNLTPEQIADFQRRRQQIIAEYDTAIYKMRQNDIEAQLELVKKGSEEEIALLIRQNEIARQLALAENAAKPIEERQSPQQINAQFNKRGKVSVGQAKMSNFDQAQSTAEAEFMAVRRSETAITIFKLEQERDRWLKQIALAKEGALDWSDAQIQEAKALINKLNREIDEAGDFMNLIGEKGFGGALLTKLGFDDKQISALDEATNIIIENIQAIADAEVEAAERAVEAAEARVEAAQKAYDAEIEGRNNGYANNVATAKKELQQEQRNQQQKQRLLEEAQRRQEAVNSIVQASSLITASANLWSAFSSIPFIGPALAIAAIATMWSSFAIAKVRAAQITKSSSEEYGEGGLEFLEGGSHASGKDIDLQTKNSKGKNMRAEGGEAMAIINKRNTRKYKKVLPEIISSLNKGTFEEKFSRAFESGEILSQQINYNSSADLSRLEEDVKALKENTAKRYYFTPDGATVVIKKNVTSIIR